MTPRTQSLASLQKQNKAFVEKVSKKQKAAVKAEAASDIPQHLTALQKGNRIRLRRAADKREIKALPRMEAYGMIADILEHPPEYWEGGSPMELLMAVRRHGRFFSLTFLRKAGVPESRKVSELTERQRFALAGVLREGAAERRAA